MIHNGIEYGLMQAYAEGFDILRNAHAEALPADERYDLDLADIAEVWRRGSVITSWLLDLTATALAEDADAGRLFGATCEDSGEGRWTVKAAIDEAVPAEVLTAALLRGSARARSIPSPRRYSRPCAQGFGGHKERRPSAPPANAPNIVQQP